MTIEKSAPIFIAGYRGLVGSAILRMFRMHGYDNVILRGKNGIDLRSSQQVHDLFSTTRQSFVDATKIHGLGWRHQTPLGEGPRSVIEDYERRFRRQAFGQRLLGRE